MEWRTSRRACGERQQASKLGGEAAAYDFVAVLGINADATVKREAACAAKYSAKAQLKGETHARLFRVVVPCEDPQVGASDAEKTCVGSRVSVQLVHRSQQDYIPPSATAPIAASKNGTAVP